MGGKNGQWEAGLVDLAKVFKQIGWSLFMVSRAMLDSGGLPGQRWVDPTLLTAENGGETC